MGIFKGSQDPKKLAKKQAAKEELLKLRHTGKEELKDIKTLLTGKAKAEVSRQLDNLKNPGTAVCEGVSVKRLYEVILKSGSELKYSIVHSEASSGVIVFQTHHSEKRWDGNLSCSVYEVANGSEFNIRGQAQQGVLIASTMSQLTQGVSEGAASHQQAKLKKIILKNIENVPERVSQSEKISDDSLTSQLSKLTELFKAGALSQEEFEKAKRKLLL